eukprot:TRINITY_DN40724_c0_g1_i1.p1 TRINITY_DN40724_c0_g1~~TRINITY_DN40724_c0_g1_i1.p1  ORF type:complete len:427 (+),score=93.58 TRINITY_DN40724_c0_g1_i1:70-1350(+)
MAFDRYAHGQRQKAICHPMTLLIVAALQQVGQAALLLPVTRARLSTQRNDALSDFERRWARRRAYAQVDAVREREMEQTNFAHLDNAAHLNLLEQDIARCKSGSISLASSHVEVVVSTFDDNLRWLLAVNAPISVYVHNRSGVRTHCYKEPQLCPPAKTLLAEESQSWLQQRTANREHPIKFVDIANVGDEGHSFLYHIISHYDELPKALVFVHGHQRSWHSPLAMDQELANTCFNPARDGYLNLNRGADTVRNNICTRLNETKATTLTQTLSGDAGRNAGLAAGTASLLRDAVATLFGWMASNAVSASTRSATKSRAASVVSTQPALKDHREATAEETEYVHELLSKHWNDTYQEELGDFPREYCIDCCAQFAVSRERILRHPRAFYERLLDLVLAGETSLEREWRMLFVCPEQWGRESSSTASC